jgi:hypothetical protein
VQNFYPSIYTHSIDWAIRGKAAAKASSKNTPPTLGEQLDAAFRGAQEGQTVGIAIGPDTSLVMAECIMVRVEEAVRNTSPSLVGYRYWDDFELAFPTLSALEEALSALQEALSAFELSLNPRKTRIVDLPEPQVPSGFFELGAWDLGPTSVRRQRHQLIGYFDEVFARIAAGRGGNTAAFAVARLRSVAIAPANWPLVQNNLLQILVVEPTSARYIGEIIERAATTGTPIDRSAMAQATELLITKHARLGHGSEVAWALWICIANKVAISAMTAAALPVMIDNLVALLALHALSTGLVPAGTLNTSGWEALMTPAELRGANWLLAYEASIQKWLPSSGRADHIAHDPFFADLRANGVSFYDATKLKVSSPTLVATSGGLTLSGP